MSNYFSVSNASQIKRSGIYEIEDDDMGAENLDDPSERAFTDLIEPSVILAPDA